MEQPARARHEPGRHVHCRPPPAAPGRFGHPAGLEGPGTKVGPYKLLEPIGEGGMGVVFLAEQEQPVRRKVALKIIKPGMDTSQVIARFEAERQALALMDHPNIAKVLRRRHDRHRPAVLCHGAGQGVPITEYCRPQPAHDPRTARAVRARVPGDPARSPKGHHPPRRQAVERAGDAEYDGKPVPKIIDFGVAKAIDQQLTEQTMFTQFGSVIGTLEYMSPEQAELARSTSTHAATSTRSACCSTSS